MHEAYSAHAAKFDPHSREMILAGFGRWMHRGQSAATDPAPAVRPFARAATRLVIDLDATGKASVRRSTTRGSLPCSPAPIDRATCSSATARTRPQGQERRDRARPDCWLSRVDRSLLMLLATQRCEPLVELVPGQKPVVARDQRAGVGREQLAALHGIAEHEAVEQVARDEADREAVTRPVAVDHGSVMPDRAEPANPVGGAEHGAARAHADQADRARVAPAIRGDHGRRIGMVDAGQEQDISGVDEILPVRVVRGHHVLEIDGYRRAELARDRQQLAGPVHDREVGEPRPRQHAATQRQVGLQRHRSAAVLEVLAPAVAAHEVDAAVGTARVDEQPGQIDAVARQRVAHQAATVIVADRPM